MRAAPCLTLLLATPISAFLKPLAPESAMGDLIATMFMPIIGVLLSNGLYFSGLPAVYRAQKTGTLGDLDPGRLRSRSGLAFRLRREQPP